MVDVDAELLASAADAVEKFGGVGTAGGVDLKHVFDN